MRYLRNIKSVLSIITLYYWASFYPTDFSLKNLLPFIPEEAVGKLGCQSFIYLKNKPPLFIDGGLNYTNSTPRV